MSTRTAPHQLNHTRRAATSMLALVLAVVVALGAVGAMAPSNAAASAAADLECLGATATIVGTPGDDVIRGTNGRDVIVAGRGDDRINGRGGDDLICGRSGDDKILGGNGDDQVLGWRGEDLISGGSGNDRLLGGLQADKLLGGAGDDVLVGGAASDECDGGPGANQLIQCEVTPNEAPTDLTLAPTAVPENKPAGTVVGTLSAVDADAGDTHAFTLVTGTGGSGNSSFAISGSSLRTAAVLDHETTPALSIRVRATDAAGLLVEKTFTITVTDVDDLPVAVDDTKTITEDAAATAVDVLANDTDTDGGPKTVTAVTQPTHGTVVITGGGSGLTYEPDADYCNGGIPTDDFTYTLNGGDTGAVTVTVTCVDDAPVAVDDAKTLAEDDPATAIDVLANDTDVDAGPKSIQSVTQPAHGTVLITGGGSGLTYAPNANYCNDGAPPTDDFTYTLAPGGDVAKVAVTVTCFDDPPVAVDDSATVAEDSGATPVAVLANDTDGGDGGPKAVQSVTQPTNGTVVITGGGSGLTYAPDANYCNSPPGTTPDTFTYTLNGGDTATVSVTVTCSDDAPVAVNDSATVAEDAGPSPVDVLANDTDVDGGPKSVQSITQPANGSAVITGGGTGVSYTPNANYCNQPPGTSPDTFTYTLNGGSTATVSVTVACAADAPVVDTSAGTTSYTENGAPTVIDPGVTVADPDGSSITGATVQISANFAGAQDDLALSGVHPGITAAQVGDTLTLSGTASTAAYQSALRDVTYANGSDSPSTLLRTVTFSVTDDSALSGSDTKGLQVTSNDDNPAAVNDSTTVGEDSGVTLIFVLTNDTDVDGGPIAVSSVTQPANGTVSNNGTDVSYTPNANYCNNPPGTSPDTFTYTLTPGGSTATVSVTVTCAADPPDVTTSGGALAYTENDPATPVDPGLTVTDPDAGGDNHGCDGGDHRQLRRRPGRPRAVGCASRHLGGAAGRQHPHADRHRHAGRLPVGLARRDLPEHLRGPVDAGSHRDVHRHRRHGAVRLGDPGHHRRRGQRPAPRGERLGHHRRGHPARRRCTRRSRERHGRGSGRHEDGGRPERHWNIDANAAFGRVGDGQRQRLLHLQSAERVPGPLHRPDGLGLVHLRDAGRCRRAGHGDGQHHDQRHLGRAHGGRRLVRRDRQHRPLRRYDAAGHAGRQGDRRIGPGQRHRPGHPAGEPGGRAGDQCADDARRQDHHRVRRQLHLPPGRC